MTIDFFIDKTGIKHTVDEIVAKIGLTYSGAIDRIKRANNLASANKWAEAEKMINQPRQKRKDECVSEKLSPERLKNLKEIAITDPKKIALLDKYFPEL